MLVIPSVGSGTYSPGPNHMVVPPHSSSLSSQKRLEPQYKRDRPTRLHRSQNPRYSLRFSGFISPRYTQVPDELFDDLMSHLSGAELKVLLYIIRRTFGFKKDVDNISLNQICKGIITRDGEVLDKGTGLSQQAVITALKGLVEKNAIVAKRRSSKQRGYESTTYSLH